MKTFKQLFVRTLHIFYRYYIKIILPIHEVNCKNKNIECILINKCTCTFSFPIVTDKENKNILITMSHLKYW